jgi:hypothetical protein
MMQAMDTVIRDRYRGVPLGAEAFIPFLNSDLGGGAGTATLELKAGKFLRLKRTGSTLTVRSGEVWITEQGNPRDIVLRSGQSFTVARRGLALVEAFSDASLSFN